MQADPTTRLLLAGILASLIVLVVQGFGGDPPLRGTPLEEGGAGRYRVMSTRAGTPVLIRTDTATGRVWKLELRGGRDRWIELIEPDEKPAGERAGDAPEAEPTPLEPVALPAPAAAPAPAPEPAAASDPAGSAGPDLTTYLDAAHKTGLPPDIRIWAITQLGASDDPRSTEALVGALGDADPRVVAAAIAAVASRRDDARVAEALAELRSHEDPAVQAALAGLERR